PDLPTTLAWQTTIGTQPLDVAITGSDGSQYRDLKHTDQLTLAPSRSTRYQISVSNSEGAQARAATIFVDDIDIASFEPSPPIVGPDEPFELTWTYTAPFDPEFGTATIHPDLGDVSGRTVTSAGPIAGDTTYTLLLEDRDLHNGPHQLDAATTEVKYSSRPLVDRFEVTPERQCRAASGNSVELAWRVHAASAIYLNGAPIDRAGSQTLAITSTTDLMLH